MRQTIRLYSLIAILGLVAITALLLLVNPWPGS